MTQPDHQRIAVIGGGVAAHSALKAFLAAAGDTVGTTSVDVFTREAHRPYRRPSVNKDILIDGKSADEVALPGAVFDGSDSVDVTLHLDSEVTAVDTAARTLTVDGGDVAWDQLILATGASPRRLDAPWLEGREVHYIRTPEHSTALRESLTALSADDNVVVIGGGILGLEAAAGASTLTDATVTVLEAQDDICRRIMPAAAAAWSSAAGPPVRFSRPLDGEGPSPWRPPRRTGRAGPAGAPCRGRPGCPSGPAGPQGSGRT